MTEPGRTVHPPPGEAGAYTRDESAAHRIDRNYGELLQELRVVETGVQILFAFLLAIAFQQRFTGIDAFDRAVFVVTLLSTATTTTLVVAPVALHRFTFRLGRKDSLVLFSQRMLIAGLATLMLSILGSVLLVLDRVVGRPFAVVATAGLAVGIGSLWFAWPLTERRARAADPPAAPR